jgi:hypothetical protein
MEISEYQERVDHWMCQVFGEQVLFDLKERSHRFAEEAIELLQSVGYTKEEMKTMLDYVYDRPIGQLRQEAGGVMHCLAALCSGNKLSLEAATLSVLQYCEENSAKIREKHSNKPDSIASNKNYEDGKETNTMP